MILGSFLSILNEKNHPKKVTTVLTHSFKNCNKRLEGNGFILFIVVLSVQCNYRGFLFSPTFPTGDRADFGKQRKKMKCLEKKWK